MAFDLALNCQSCRTISGSDDDRCDEERAICELILSKAALMSFINVANRFWVLTDSFIVTSILASLPSMSPTRVSSSSSRSVASEEDDGDGGVVLTETTFPRRIQVVRRREGPLYCPARVAPRRSSLA